MIRSKALEANLASYKVEVKIDPRYNILKDVFSRYYGLMEGLNTFIKELSHPNRNLNFIVGEARGYALNYFHFIKNHEKGHEAVRIFTEIFFDVFENAKEPEVIADAVDNLLLFIQKVIKESGASEILKFLPVLNQAFKRIRSLDDESFFLFVKSYYQMEKLGEELAYYSSELTLDLEEINLLLIRYFRYVFTYWLRLEEPYEWFSKEALIAEENHGLEDIFQKISHKNLRALKKNLEEIVNQKNKGDKNRHRLYQLAQLLTLPGYNRMVSVYRQIPQKLLEAGKNAGRGNRWKIIFLFHIMNISGLSAIHEEALRDINRTISWLINNETYTYIEKLIGDTFSILKKQAGQFPLTALNVVLNMGKGVYKTDESDLIRFFINCVIDLGFQAPMIGGVGNDWQIRVNSAHIQNIRTWLELIRFNPKWSTRLLSYLIIHLSLSGVFIKDTDLFPRDITMLLNSDIRPVYNLVKQLARLFPVYFNDIGAEGELRDISTEIDEETNRKDLLIHFLRKQTHVESSNRVVGFIEAVINFWATKDKTHVKTFVPPNIYEQIMENGPYIDGVHEIFIRIRDMKEEVVFPGFLLDIDEEKLDRLIRDINGLDESDIKRVKLAARLYKLLHHKYNLVMGMSTCDEIHNYLVQLKLEAFPDLDRLKSALNEPDDLKRLPLLLSYMEELKELILSSEQYEIREDIYKKRHFTVDIPSMYGSYHELKFDALGLTFRIESIVNVCFEQIVDNINLELITKETFYRIYDLLKLFNSALKLDGISSVEFENQMEMLAHSLKARGFTFTQYLDIFKGLARAVANVINDYFNNIHENNLNRILKQMPKEMILDKYLPKGGIEDWDREKHRISEIFFRDKISLSLGLRQLDLLLSQILNTLFHQSYKLPSGKLRLLLNYDPQRAMTSISHADEKIFGIIHLGNKGNNLVKLNRLGFPTPPGFIITTEVFRCRDIIECYDRTNENFKAQIAHHISSLEKITGKRFGDPQKPLLFSVRSGSSISQPGMMDTFLNVGMNEDIAKGIAKITGNMWFAWDNYRRFIQCYGMSYDLERDIFDAIMKKHKKKRGVIVKREFNGRQMKALALDYKKAVMDAGIEIIEDPFEQVLLTIRKVLNSWESAKAKTYRKIIGISDDWGTAVTVQSMVYGNLSNSAGSGVIFTHNPRWSEEDLRLWGDFTIGNQGEDVVAGLVSTLPISMTQQENEKRNTDITLETHFTEIYKTLKEWASEIIYKRGWSPQEIEFTFESPKKEDLYLLQSRNMSMRERKKVLTFDPEEMTDDKKYLGNGIGVSGGAMSGRVVFSLEEIDMWRRVEPHSNLILIRGDTVPDDILEINAADGLLTARGGVTSHAAVVAHYLGKTCVVGCANLVCNETSRTSYFDGELIKSGDFISIDGQDGFIYKGFMRTIET